jgi:threonine dehydrogenase-like Zn-dependent dehydrogenase
MLAVWLENGEVQVREVPKPEPAPDEALLRVLMTGVCNTDLELLAGYYGFAGIPGHEFVGIVDQAPARPELEGHRVVAEINLGCGRCARCQGGDPRHCADREALGIKGAPGAMAEYVTVPFQNLLVVDEEISDRQAVFAEPLAAALEPAQQMHLTARTKLLVLGDGKLGLLCALGLRHWVPGLVLAGRHDGKLALAEAQGVATVKSDDHSLEAQSFDVVLEATGRPEGLARALDLVRPEGTVIAKTTSHEPSSLDLAKLVVNEITLLGSRCGDMRLALHFLKNRLVDPEPMIQAEFALAQAEQAFDAAKVSGELKMLIKMT